MGIKILDCTLRDGGYCNQWKFGKNNILKIENGLVDSGIDIIECGFLSNKCATDENISKYASFKEIDNNLHIRVSNTILVAMINYGEFGIEDVPNCQETKLDGLRVAFHKKDKKQAILFCKELKKKGYMVFIQPMVSLRYSDEEFLSLINEVNRVEPFAFYIVDSFGVMKRKELIRLFFLVEHNLKETIEIGYHSHNNMQMAYANAQELVENCNYRNIIIDASVFGMGRGAGNLNTELFAEYLNDNFNYNYKLEPLLKIIDEVLTVFYQKNYWGYSLPNYLSAKHNIHPNYANYLEEKKTLTVECMNEIFSLMSEEKRYEYDKDYIEKLYLTYMNSEQVLETEINQLKKNLGEKTILIIAPGKSSIEEKEKIIAFAKKDSVITISVNFNYPEYDVDYIFVSNLRRFKALKCENYKKCIVTSNISASNVYVKIKYGDLLNDQEQVYDNAGLMLIRFLMNLNVKSIYLAGMDGYSTDPEENYASNDLEFITDKRVSREMNLGITKVLSQYAKKVDLHFLTKKKNIDII